MKKNNLGFVLAETLIVSTVVLTTLVIIYTQFRKVQSSYTQTFKYNSVDTLYRIVNIKNYIKTEEYNNLKLALDVENYIELSSCHVSYFTELSYCRSLFEKLDVKRAIFAKGNLFDLKSNMNNFEQGIRNFIDQTKDNSGDFFYIIVEFNNDLYGSLIVS